MGNMNVAVLPGLLALAFSACDQGNGGTQDAGSDPSTDTLDDPVDDPVQQPAQHDGRDDDAEDLQGGRQEGVGA